MDDITTPYKQLPTGRKDSNKEESNEPDIRTNASTFELQQFQESAQNNNCEYACAKSSSGFSEKYWSVDKRTVAVFSTLVMIISVLLISVIYTWMLQQKSNNNILDDITSLKKNLERDNTQIIKNITTLKRKVEVDNRIAVKEIAKLQTETQTESQNILKEVSAIRQNLKDEIGGLSKEISGMKKSIKKDYCYGKSICYPYPTCYGKNCTCGPILKRDQTYCQRSQCWPSQISSAYSNTKNGRTYMTIGSSLYKLKHRVHSETFASVAPSWPRSCLSVWNGFEEIDEMFIHTDKNTYIFSGDEYMVHLETNNNTQSLLPAKKIGRGTDRDGRPYIGWPGLKHSKYINAAMHVYNDETYIFQDDLVYLWNSSIQTTNLGHYPKGAVAKGWPKKISKVFPGIPNHIDTAFLYYWDDKIYFFKGLYFYTWTNSKAKGPHRTKDYFRYLCETFVCGNDQCTQSDGQDDLL